MNDSSSTISADLSKNFLSYVVLAPTFALLILWIIAGNMLVMIAIGKYAKLQSMSNFLIANLALSDCFLAIAVLPLSATSDVTGQWLFGNVLCNLWLSIDVFLCTASVWNLVVIALDRFTATTFPLWYKVRRTSRYTLLYVSLVWILAILVCLPPLFFWGKTTSKDNDTTTTFKTYVLDESSKTYNCLLYDTRSYVLYSASGSFIIPLIIMLILYAKIFTTLSQRTKVLRARKQATYNALSSNHSSGMTVGVDMSNKSDYSMISDVISNTKTNGHHANTFAKKMSNSDILPSQIDCSSSQQSLSPPIVKNQDVKSPKLNDNSSPILHSPLIMEEETSTGSRTNLQLSDTAFNYPDSPKIVDEESTNLIINSPQTIQNPRFINQTLPNEQTIPQSRRPNNIAQQKPKFNIASKFDAERDRLDKRERKATIQMALVIFTFVICWIPFTVMYIIRAWCKDACVERENLRMFLTWLGYANSGINPVLYAVMNEDFRRAFVNILSCSR